MPCPRTQQGGGIIKQFVSRPRGFPLSPISYDILVILLWHSLGLPFICTDFIFKFAYLKIIFWFSETSNCQLYYPVCSKD